MLPGPNRSSDIANKPRTTIEGVTGTVYTESIVHAAPEALVSEAPYQIAIVIREDGTRVTARIQGERVSIGDPVQLVEERGEVAFFRKA